MIITFFNQKGGVGKTTTCILFSDYLVKLGKKVLLIDLDPQGTLTDIFVEDAKFTLWDFFQNNYALSEIKTPIDKNRDILPSSISMFKIAEIDSTSLIGDKERFNFIAENYDYVIVDCPPNLGTFSRLGLLLADKLFMPVEATKPSHSALRDGLATVGTLSMLNSNLKGFKVFQNQSEKHRPIKASYEELFKKELGDKWIPFPFPNSTHVQQRLAIGGNFFDSYKNENVNQFFDNLLKEVNNG